MDEFRKLLKTLESELAQQEELLALLASERVAIVQMNQERIEQLVETKGHIFEKAINLQKERDATIESIVGKDIVNVQKFSDIVVQCQEEIVKHKLEKVGTSLKETATGVMEMNKHNEMLIRQAIGLVASTIAIMRCAPGTELPTYTDVGRLSASSEDPVFTSRPSRSLVRAA